jgi:citrate synthase
VNDQVHPGLEDVVATESEISFLDTEHEQIVVRGYDLIELARGSTYADVAHLLLFDHLPSDEERAAFARRLGDHAHLPEGMADILRRLPSDTVAMDALRSGLSILAGYENAEVLSDHSRVANLAKAVRILAKCPTLAANAFRALRGQPFVQPNPGLSYAASFLQMIYGRPADGDTIAIFDRILICYAEHELANSTFAARIVASTFADIYGAIVAATAALRGPLHGGANGAAARMFAQIASRGGPAAAEGYLLKRLAAKDRIMGFGHRVYMHRPDPRAELLKADLDAIAARDPDAAMMVQTYEIVVAVMEREKDLHPNADLPIGLLLSLLGIPIDLFTPIFLCARGAGLLAHVVEQHEHNRLYRPRVRYTGPSDLQLSGDPSPSV